MALKPASTKLFGIVTISETLLSTISSITHFFIKW